MNLRRIINSNLLGLRSAAISGPFCVLPRLLTPRSRPGNLRWLSVAPNPGLVFLEAWSQVCRKLSSEDRLASFPGEIVWLCGAPGAGKGLATKLIMELRGITAPPLEVSGLLCGPEAEQLKAQGRLVSDAFVVQTLLEALLFKPEYSSGAALIDGYPRTAIQAECMKLLHEKLWELHETKGDKFRRPIFHIVVMFIDEELSVQRQLSRGRKAIAHNKRVLETGVGQLLPTRPTDLDEGLARSRYAEFRKQVQAALSVIKDKFPFHFVDADGGVEDVRSRLVQELEYQSKFELAESTFQAIKVLPLAKDLARNARSELVRRLDEHEAKFPELFDRVIKVLYTDFIPILKRQALSGEAIINSENSVFTHKHALDIALDILTERGYRVYVDVQHHQTPKCINKETLEIEVETTKVFKFTISFKVPS